MTGKPPLLHSLTKSDRDFMSLALHLGRRGLGRVAPNPAVGCVITKQGKIIGRGWTQPGGRPHAETEALLQAGTEAEGAKVYVTLEPCAHHGQTGPCAEALIKAGVSEVHVALKDPDARVAGRGIEMLEAASIVVALYEDDINILAAELNSGFLTLQHLKRPMVTLKIATDQNGMMRTPPGQDRQITGTLAQRRMHLMRAEHDVILVGRGTVEADNPSLNCRLPGLGSQSPMPAVATSQKTLPDDYVLSGHPDLILLNDISPLNMLKKLGQKGFTRVLLEGGPRLAKAFLNDNCVDEIVHFQSPNDFKDTSWPPEQSDLQLMGIENMSSQTKYSLSRLEIWSTDIANTVAAKEDAKDNVFFYRRVKPHFD
ncbi:MAG: riboflavin biosynthesis protein RibD [Rhizobiales bacterium TMED249]|uniref:Riboflavin biosynthesis protein RibD n=1 Tax=PS1 clade bacterium TaxID=2175152 RepID=A0A368E0B3_9PROT|nr:MAG: riboflavin biosynthesis protein RibD [Rhizobiales bacterium TMED249]RCL77558.1 MAG: bifunctional diaminohydroxyphosphoribosylaminopyrimidine deaminase/5-amino-6-(5-phosphoribosylamino)uracil reductase RibD [PS1 clade bacterium]HCV49424.1 bifunctional diaminohydroxyphosphoribosylaminopyrimidine deaminase/5-amino-6-(5-phosphoribosylamino)uracil reductase RibD [Rhodobiaceae bacterium]|tara:strand:+ start:7258 stop:8367 length:1110 start_codon:yes stop_codon:yes gene_type:complete